MADKYCDHGAYSSVLGTTPTWGSPQDGDGDALSPSNSSSIASIVFSSVPSSGSIVICGVTFTDPSGVINAASVNDAANSLASLINSSTVTVTSSVATGTPQLRNLVFARGPSGGAPAGTCEIMMRVGSNTLNYSNNLNVAINNTFNISPTITQFQGGVSGCWGWFFNPVPIGVSNSISVGQYGIFLNFPMVGVIPTETDTVWVRTGTNKTITTNLTSSTTFSHANFGTNFVFDNNTKWTGDTSNGKLKLYFSATSWGTGHGLRSSVFKKPTSYTALSRGGFEIEFYGNTATEFSISPVINSDDYREKWVNILFRDSGEGPAGSQASFSPFIVSSPNGSIQRLYENCDFVVTNPRTTLWRYIFSSPYNTRCYFLFNGCTFNFNISGIADPGFLMDVNSYISDCTHEFLNCEFLGRSSGYKMVNSTTNWQSNGTRLVLIMDNCSGLQMPNNYLGLPTNQTVMTRPDQHLIIQDNMTSVNLRGYRYEDCRGVLEWLPDDATPFPTLTSTIQGLGIPYSMRAIWLQMANISPGYPFRTPAFKAFVQLPSSIRILTLELFVPTSVVSGISAQFSYRSPDGALRSQVTQLIENSSSTWTGSENYPTFKSVKLRVTTEYQVAENSEISCSLSFNYNAPESVTNIYIDPEIGVN